jgi:hypothetical protein
MSGSYPMNDVREVIAEAIPCNIVYGRPQAADDIMQALTSAGFRIVGPREVDKKTVEKCADVAYRHIQEPSLSDNPAYVRFEPADFMAKKIASAIRALAKEKQGC